MSAAYIRWRCERIAELLNAGTPRLEALAIARQEEVDHPWENDPRPAPPPLPMGGYYSHQPAN